MHLFSYAISSKKKWKELFDLAVFEKVFWFWSIIYLNVFISGNLLLILLDTLDKICNIKELVF